MKGMSSIHVVLGFILIITASPCFSSQVAQPQGPVKERQRTEQVDENTAKLNQALFAAVVKGLGDEVTRLISHGADIDTQNRAGFTPLFLAVQRGNVEMVKLLVEKGARFDVAVRGRMAVIHLAVAQGKREIVEVFVSHGADISTLHMAVVMGDLARVRSLVGQGVDVNAKDELGKTPLFWAISLRQIKVVDLLITQGADVNAKTQDGQTPLYIAVIRGSREVMEMLIANGAEVTSQIVTLAVRSKHEEIVDLFLGDKAFATSVFLSAAANRDKNLAKQALDQGADVNASDQSGVTSLHRAAVRVDKEIGSLLLNYGGDVHAKDSAARAPLHYATGATGRVRSPQQEVANFIDLLLAEGANVNVQDKWGYTPLHYAVLVRRVDVVKLLLEREADANLANNRGQTPYSTLKLWTTYFAQLYHSTKEYTPQELKRLQEDTFNYDSQREYEGVDFQMRLIQLREIASLLHKGGHRYVVATEGKDSNPGTDDRPFRTLVAAVAVAEPGDVILVHPGVYVCSHPLRLNKSGGYGKRIHIRAYSQERPILDFSGAREGSVYITGAHWHLKGLILTQGEPVIFMTGDGAHHNILEQITMHNNFSSGIQFRNGPSYNIVLNCDSYLNYDPQDNGDNCDGIALGNFIGNGNVLLGNRAWNNTDDGFDFFHAGNGVRLERCYAWSNGHNGWMHPSPFFAGDGSGFKLGGGLGRHILINCVAWNNPLRGFNHNSNRQGVILHNCTGWNNFRNYVLKDVEGPGGEGHVLRNSLSYRGEDALLVGADSWPNSWDYELGLTLTDNDFLSLDDSMMTAPRNPDGSIPYNNFLRLAPGSAAIDAGVDVNMPYVGKAPDLGAFEYDPNENAENYVKMLHQYVRDHDIDKINELLLADIDINDKDWLGYAPLHWACYFGYSDLVELLIGKGADANLVSDTGRTPLEIATSMEYTNIADLLREQGAR
ncbi:ankyrin repeat domain-containing protein [Planctomycetota bacterium]